MESKNFMPEIDLFPRLTRVANFIRHMICFNPVEAPDYMSNHHKPSNYWLEAEALHDDGATSPSTFDTFEPK